MSISYFYPEYVLNFQPLIPDTPFCAQHLSQNRCMGSSRDNSSPQHHLCQPCPFANFPPEVLLLWQPSVAVALLPTLFSSSFPFSLLFRQQQLHTTLSSCLDQVFGSMMVSPSQICCSSTFPALSSDPHRLCEGSLYRSFRG